MLPPAAQPFLPLQLLSAVLHPPLPLQEFLPLQPLSPGIATALSFTIVLTFASVLAFFEVNQVVEARTSYAGNASSVGAHSKGSGQETGNRSAGHDRFGWFHCLSTFSLFGFMVVTFTTTN